MAFANNPRRIGLAVLAAAATALLVWFGTGLFPMWPLLWFAPIPVLLFAPRGSAWSVGLVALVAWAVGYLNMAHYYTSVIQLPNAVLAEAIVVPALVFACAVLLYRTLLLRGAPWTALLAFPSLWVCMEYAVNRTSPHGTAVSVAYSQLNCLPLLQLASITGPWGISFVVLAFAAAVAIAMHLRSTAPNQALRIVAATLGVVAAVLIFGAVRLALPPPPHQDVRVGLVASDLPENKHVAASGPATDRLLHDYAEQAEALAARGAQVVVLPEHLGEVVDPNTTNADTLFHTIADTTRATIVVGVSHVTSSAAYNEARVYAPGTATVSYDKEHLLPPFESMFTPGRSLVTMPERTGKWGVAICKDMDFTPLSRHYGQSGAGLMLVPAWDFTLDRVSHGHIAIMRGVESGFAIARAARGGSLMVTDNRGRILGETQSNSAPFATLLVDVPAVHDKTLYLLWGDWFAWVAVAVLALALLRLVFTPRSGR